MKSLRYLNKDRVSGVVLLVLGLAIVAQGAEYRMRTLTRIGASFVPVVLGILLALVGVAISITAEPGDFGTTKSSRPKTYGAPCCSRAEFLPST